MKIAILCQCHKNAEQVNRLIKSMQYNDVFDFYIHVDKKSNISNGILKNDHVFVLSNENCVNVLWGDISQVTATLKMIECAKKKKYDYYWLLSGQDFPIKSPKYIVEFLEKDTNKNYINLFEGEKHKKTDFKRNEIYYCKFLRKRGLLSKLIKRLYIEITGGWEKTYPLFKRKSIENLQVNFFFGSSWWCLNGRTIEWMMKYIEKNPNYVKFYRNTLCPDESFFQTLFMNSPFKDSKMEYLTYVDWSSGKSNPRILTLEDKDNIFASDFLIARKFDAEIDEDIIEELEMKIARETV